MAHNIRSWLLSKFSANLLIPSYLNSSYKQLYKMSPDMTDVFLNLKIEQSVNPIALRKTKIVYNFGLSECNRVKDNGCSVQIGIYRRISMARTPLGP